MSSYSRRYDRYDRRDDRRGDRPDETLYLVDCKEVKFKCQDKDKTKYKLNYIDKTATDKNGKPLYIERLHKYKKFILDLENFKYNSSISIRFNAKVSEDSEGKKIYTRIPDQYKLSIDELPNFKLCKLCILNTAQLIVLLSKVYYLTKNCNICDFIEAFKYFVNKHIDEIFTGDIRWIILVENDIEIPSFIQETKENLLAAINELKCKDIDSIDLKCTETSPINKHKRITLNKPAKDGSRPLIQMFGSNDAPVRLYYIDHNYKDLDDIDLKQQLNYSQMIKYSTLKFSQNIIDGKPQSGECKLILTGNNHNSLNNLLTNGRSKDKAFEIVFLSSVELLMLLNRVAYLIDMDKKIVDDTRFPVETDKFNFKEKIPEIKMAFIEQFYKFFESNKITIANNNIRWACIVEKSIKDQNYSILLENKMIIDKLLKTVLEDEDDLLTFYFNSIIKPEGEEAQKINDIRIECKDEYFEIQRISKIIEELCGIPMNDDIATEILKDIKLNEKSRFIKYLEQHKIVGELREKVVNLIFKNKKENKPEEKESKLEEKDDKKERLEKIVGMSIEKLIDLLGEDISNINKLPEIPFELLQVLPIPIRLKINKYRHDQECNKKIRQVEEKIGKKIEEIDDMISEEELEEIYSILIDGTGDYISCIRELNSHLEFMLLAYDRKMKDNKLIIEATGLSINEINSLTPDDKKSMDKIIEVLADSSGKNLIMKYINPEILEMINNYKHNPEKTILERTGYTIEQINNLDPDTDSEIIKTKIFYRLSIPNQNYLYDKLTNPKLKTLLKSVIDESSSELSGGKNTYNMYQNIHKKYLSYIQKYNYF